MTHKCNFVVVQKVNFVIYGSCFVKRFQMWLLF